MRREELLKTLAGVFAEVFGRPVEITEATTAADVEDWDSVAHVLLIVASEQAFGVRFTSTELANAANVGEFIRLVERKKGY